MILRNRNYLFLEDYPRKILGLYRYLRNQNEITLLGDTSIRNLVWDLLVSWEPKIKLQGSALRERLKGI